MKPNKKIFEKIQFFRWIVSAAIFFVVIFQSYSLISYYNHLENIFNGMLNDEFEEAVTDYREIILKKAKLKFTIVYKSGNSSPNVKKDSSKISAYKKIERKKGVSLDETLKKLPGFPLSTLPIYINRLDSIYGAKLEQKHLFLDYKIVVYKTGSDSIVATSNSAFDIQNKKHSKPFELDVKRTAQVYFNNPAWLIIKQMAMLLFLSALMLVLIVVLLIYQLHIIQKQKQIEKVRRDFTDSMTHELKNPLQGAIALSEILSQPLFSEDVERRNQGIEKIKNNLHRINSLLESITQRSYAENLQQAAHIEKGNLPETIQQLIADFKILTDKNVVFETHFEPCNIPYTYDLLHFPNVIKNLIDNAIKYSENELTIKISLTHTANDFTVAVSDNGLGIKSNDLPKVFDKFYRGYNKGKKYGFGLGLSYVKWVTDLHKGDVQVESKFGKGSTFRVIIPFVELREKE